MNPFTLARVHAGAVSLLALLVLSATLLLAALPRTMEAAADAALADTLLRSPASRVDLTARALNLRAPLVTSRPQDFARWDAHLRSLLPEALRPLVTRGGASHYRAQLANGQVVNGVGIELAHVEPAWIATAEQRVRYVEGRPPGPPGKLAVAPGRQDLRDLPLFEISMLRSAAQEMRIPLGSTLVLGTTSEVAAKVTGLFELKDEADRFWDHNLAVRRVNHLVLPGDRLERHVTALVSQETLSSLPGVDRLVTYAWTLAIDPGATGSRSVGAVLDGLAEYRNLVGTQEMAPWKNLSLETEADKLLTGYRAEQAAASTVMNVMLGGLAIVALGVLVLAVQLLVERTDQHLALARARGGSLRQVAGVGTMLLAVAVLPAAAVGYAVAAFVPGPVTAVVHAGPAMVVLATVGGGAALLARRHRAPLHERRTDLVGGRVSLRRGTAEVAVILLGVAAALLLRSRGLTTGVAEGGLPTGVAEQGGDPLLLLAPFALAVSVALVTLRCYPFPLRLLGSLAARGQRAVPFLGLTLAARSRPLAALPVLVLLPALAVSIFAAVLSSGISATQERAAWQTTGADARLHTLTEYTAQDIERVRRVPGVTGVVPAHISEARMPDTTVRRMVVAVDLAALRSLLTGAPLDVPEPPVEGGPAIPALAPRSMVGTEAELQWATPLPIAPKAAITSFPGLPGAEGMIVVPFDTRQRLGLRGMVTTLFVKGEGLDAARLSAAAGGRVVVREQVLSELADAPLAATVQLVFRGSIAAFALYALVAVVLALVTNAADRARALSPLRTLGLSAGQARRLTLLEVSPLLVLTTLAGIALGLALVPLLGPSVTL